jgi:diguanylate cyclase (GGDEF)-like protein
MKVSNDSARNAEIGSFVPAAPAAMIAFSLAAIAAAFILAGSTLDFAIKVGGFVMTVVSFLAACGWLYWRALARASKALSRSNEAAIGRGLSELDEAGQFFSGSLRSADAFRLIVSRIRDLLPFRSIVLFVLDPTRTKLCVAQAEGSGADGQRDRTIGFDEGLAGQCLRTKTAAVDSYLELDETQVFGLSVAIPLFNGSEVFAVLQLFFDAEVDVESFDRPLLEAVGTRVAPLMLASIAYERSQANALTDVTTDLPNERAFYLILENQIAEAQRKRDERPLTILAIDIKGFDEMNSRFGHPAGDRILNFVAQVIKDNLRQMDFLARSIGDEFLVILPTASQETAHEIVARIHTGFFGRTLTINDEESIEAEINVGWASFGGDGETPGQLLSLAQLRKEQSKSAVPSKVLWFPQETAN